MIHELTASEAVYGFASWLTCRNKSITIGATEECSPVADLVARFVVENNLTLPRESWVDNLKHPPATIEDGETKND